MIFEKKSLIWNNYVECIHNFIRYILSISYINKKVTIFMTAFDY